MDFRSLPVSAFPAYAWLWNTAITKEGIRAQIDEMYDSGIRALYVLGEPENFRPMRRRTHLWPKYLSPEYIDLVYYAYEYAKEKGMHSWLYNEGGFPSGMVCGKIREIAPELYIKTLAPRKTPLTSGVPYAPAADVIAAFAGEERIRAGCVCAADTEVTEYVMAEHPSGAGLRTDTANPRTTELFLSLTHEKLKERFGDAMGTDITLMFDDESDMGTWTDGMEHIFYEKYGYDVLDYLPVITSARQPQTDAEYRAVSDHLMLCGELVRENYFRAMQKWLREHNMLSTGHLNSDNKSDYCVINRYGNAMAILRAFDVPGIDVIWSQITYPTDGKCCFEGNQFFPRLASAAARQLGHSTAVSESFAVFGSHVTPEEMRFGVNYQAVRGISLFNFMVISYDRQTAMCLQYRPNFIAECPGMDRLGEINTYTARLSHILQNSRAEIRCALYAPFRSICARGEAGKAAKDAFEKLGDRLEAEGISFDVIDEEFVLTAEKKDGALIGEHVTYENILIPEDARFELPEVMEKMRGCGSAAIPTVLRTNPLLSARKLCFDDGSVGFFIVNSDAKTVTERIVLPAVGVPHALDLMTGELYPLPRTDDVSPAHAASLLRTPYAPCEEGIAVYPTLLRGEGVLIVLKDEAVGEEAPDLRVLGELTEFSSFVSRRFTLDPLSGICNARFCAGEEMGGTGEWDRHFSGEVTYVTKLPAIPGGGCILDLGEVRCSAKVYRNGNCIGETTFPPYRVRLDGAKEGEELRIVVANTAANVCHDAAYFDVQHPFYVGPYHENMRKYEAKAPAGGLLGPVVLLEEVR